MRDDYELEVGVISALVDDAKRLVGSISSQLMSNGRH